MDGALGARGARRLRVAFVSVEAGITALGFRRVAAVARRIDPETDIFFVTLGNLYSVMSQIFPAKRAAFDAADAAAISERLAGYDLVAFSAMTASSAAVEEIIAHIRVRSPNTFVLFGGVHAILYPDKAMEVADAICKAEGELPFEMLHAKMSAGE
ncbi:MAG: cobalamin-dependent protein, partial [Candidatus Pacebacteria bacterium]|nr:cobalamin-dependent protein [Candidatus Paceibacterota bacterium]